MVAYRIHLGQILVAPLLCYVSSSTADSDEGSSPWGSSIQRIESLDQVKGNMTQLFKLWTRLFQSSLVCNFVLGKGDRGKGLGRQKSFQTPWDLNIYFLQALDVVALLTSRM